MSAFSLPKGEARDYAELGLNLYRGCSHRCVYCYNRYLFTDPCDKLVKKSTLKNIELDLKKWEDFRFPVNLSFVGDPYDLGRQDNSRVREVLQLFRKYNYPFQVLTKGGTKAVQDFDLYGPDDRFGCTLTFVNPADSLEWEPGAALPADRIESLRWAHERGIKTWVSLEPVIDPAQTLALIEATHEFVDYYGVGKLNHFPEIEKNIDWRKFRADAEALLNRLGKEYKIKRALAEVV